MKKFINILIFLLIFTLYFVTFMMIYDNFRERKLNNQEKYALELFENKIEKKKEEPQKEKTYTVNYNGYTILGRIEIPRIGINTVVLKEHTYAAMSIGSIKTYGVDLNEKGGFVISAHNYRGSSPFFYPIRLLKNGDLVYIFDNQGRKMTYTVYSVSRYVNPNDTSYLVTTKDYHLTMVTCESGGKSRIVVKAHIVE